MKRDNDESYAQVESAVAEGVRKAGDDVRAAASMIADEVADDLRRSGVRGTTMLSTISALADGAARGAADAGAGIDVIAEGFMIGAMRGSAETPERTLAVIGHAADSFVKHAHESGFDACAAARGLVAGAAAGAEHCSIAAAAAADAAAQGAAGAADDLSPRLGRKVRAALSAAPLFSGSTSPLKEAPAPRRRF